MKANQILEIELEIFVQADDSICRTLEVRDDKLSPIRQSISYGASNLKSSEFMPSEFRQSSNAHL
jgi:hypothetical protein